MNNSYNYKTNFVKYIRELFISIEGISKKDMIFILSVLC